MPLFSIMKRLFQKQADGRQYPILPLEAQIKAWRKANRKMRWNIAPERFDQIAHQPELTENDRLNGFIGVILSYGFEDHGTGHADAVLSGKLAWDYACSRWLLKTWRCRYIEFDQPDHVRLHPQAPPRPQGFYFAKFRPGDGFLHTTVSQYRRSLLSPYTGCGPEGIQLLTVTHPHMAELMNRKKIPFMAFADYEVAPYGFSDFFDNLQMFCSNATLGLGIGNVDGNYPLFGIPTLSLVPTDP